MEGALMSLKEESTEMVKQDPAVVASAEAAKARIQSAYIMALRKPRVPDQARDSMLRACMRKSFAEKAEYARPIAGKTIRGPSVRFAEEAARDWGNILTSTYVVYDDDQTRRIAIIVTDLETNTTFNKEISVKKTVERRKPTPDREVLGQRINSEGEQVFIVRATEEEVFSKENSMISRVVRNEVLRLIPSDFVEDGMNKAKETLRSGDKADPSAAKKAILDNFSSIGVRPKDLEAYIGHPLDTVSPAELEDLRAMYQSIRSGEHTWKEFIEQKAEESKTGNPPGEEAEKAKEFEKIIPKETDRAMLQKFLEFSAEKFKLTVDQVKVKALGDSKNFWLGFGRYVKTQNAEARKAAEGAGEKPPEKPADKSQGADPASGAVGAEAPEQIECPDRPGTNMNITFCQDKCYKAENCEAYQKTLKKGE